MLIRKLKIINKLGLHARAAAKLVSITSRYSANVELKSAEQKVNGKSIMGVMMLAASQGTIIEVITNGEDEHDLILAIENLVNNKFDEDE